MDALQDLTAFISRDGAASPAAVPLSGMGARLRL